jgi:hypothetical protein
MLHQKNKLTSTLRFVVILFPLLASFAWLISVITHKITVIPTVHGLRLSPSRNITPIVTGLLLFQTGYIVFMLMMFKDEITEFFTSWKKPRQNK